MNYLRWLQSVHQELIGIREEMTAIKALNDDLAVKQLEALQTEMKTSSDALAASVANAEGSQT